MLDYSRTVSLFAGLLLAVVSAGAMAAERVGDFALLDQHGVYHNMSWYDDNKAVVLLVQVNKDRSSRDAAEALRAGMDHYTNDGVVFKMINPLGQSRDSVLRELEEIGMDIPVLIDDAQIVSEALGIERAGEVLIYDTDTHSVAYRGPAGQPFDQALQSFLAGMPIGNSELASHGSPILYAARDRHMTEGVSYSEDVAPILIDNCASCHREGGIAPFAMDSHTMVQGWSPMIREVLMTKRMPPAQIDPHIGHFSNDYVLSDADQQTLIHWIAQGAPKDGDSDPLAGLAWPQTDWELAARLGEPDIIIDIPPQEIPATGVLEYIDLVVPIEGMEQDRWLRASEYVPSDRTVLHHTLNALLVPGQAPAPGLIGSFTHPDQPYITPYIPGAEPYVEDPSTGGLLRAGTQLALNMHYTTTGRATVDQGRIGLWFYPEDEVPTQRKLGECACIFPDGWTDIPPHDPDFAQTKSVTVAYDAYLTGFHPHMHFRGKSMVFEAHYPDGTVEPLLNIARYNYDWQVEYKLVKPKFVPAGTRVVVTGTFDNSSQNPANPDPDRSVPWGQQSWDEMFFGQVYWKAADPLILDELREKAEQMAAARRARSNAGL